MEGCREREEMMEGSPASDEKEKGVKNRERSVHGGMKCSDCVSLCCTQQSEAEHLSLPSSTSLGEIKEWSGGGRKMERER